jgi:peptidoglycan/xylan/chitin deacetylase (PgdA/CDA1 family)
MNRNTKTIHLVFTGHEFGDGGKVILAALKKHHVKASFFLTGDFYRNPSYASLIAQIKREGHYLGAHSDKHLLYADWTKRDSTLVTHEEFVGDLKKNYAELGRFGIEKNDAQFFLPPYEWYNNRIADWSREVGLTLVNFTGGTYSNADYTTPDMGNRYVSSDTIYRRILAYEETHPQGLNGFILLAHIGTDPRRTDKFYSKLDPLLTELQKRGYRFNSFRDYK